MPKRTRTLTLGRFKITDEYEAVPIDADGSLGMPSDEWERLELTAAIKVVSQVAPINGDELRFARKAMDLQQPALAELLEVSVETVSCWETGIDLIQPPAQHAVLRLLERALAQLHALCRR